MSNMEGWTKQIKKEVRKKKNTDKKKVLKKSKSDKHIHAI